MNIYAFVYCFIWHASLDNNSDILLSYVQAVASEGGTDDAKRRGDAFARAFSAHLARYLNTNMYFLHSVLLKRFGS